MKPAVWRAFFSDDAASAALKVALAPEEGS
jgi:hypothetical protein